MNRTIVLDKHEMVVDKDHYYDILEFIDTVATAVGSDVDDIRPQINSALNKVVPELPKK